MFSKSLATTSIRIHPKIVLDMVQNYKLPNKSKNTLDSFTIENVIQSLANNKHNDSTTTYYLLHKKFVGQVIQDKNEALKEHEN